MNRLYSQLLIVFSITLLPSSCLFAVDYGKEGQRPAQATATQAGAEKPDAATAKSAAEDSKEITCAQIKVDMAYSGPKGGGRTGVTVVPRTP